jgi:hypothetical protein
MTKTAETTAIYYTGNASTTTFSFPFSVLSSSHLKVAVNGSVVGSGYTVSGTPYPIAAAAGSIVFSTAPASGAKVAIFRSTALDQGADFTGVVDFDEQAVEDLGDKLVLQVQDLQRQILKAYKIPDEVSGTGMKMPVPTASDYGKLIAFKDPGGSAAPVEMEIVDVDISDLESAIASAQAAQVAAELAETNAELAEANAETAETNAETAETNAEAAAAAAAASETAAAASAANASAIAGGDVVPFASTTGNQTLLAYSMIIVDDGAEITLFAPGSNKGAVVLNRVQPPVLGITYKYNGTNTILGEADDVNIKTPGAHYVVCDTATTFEVTKDPLLYISRITNDNLSQKTDDYTMVETDDALAFTISADKVLTLHAVTGSAKRKKIKNSATSAGNLRITRAGSAMINGPTGAVTSFDYVFPGQSCEIQADGTNWELFI